MPSITGMKKLAAQRSAASRASTMSTASATLRTSTGMCTSTRGGWLGSTCVRGGPARTSGSEVSVFNAIWSPKRARSPARSIGQRLPYGAQLPARHGQGFVDAVQAHRPALALLHVVVLFQRPHGAAGDQRISVHAQELPAVAVLEVAEGAVQDIAPGGGADGDVLQFRLEIQHFR